MSSPVSVTPSVETPANLSAASGSQQVALTWDAPGGNGVAKALIYQGFNSSGSGASLVNSTSSGTDTTITITGLNNGTQYYFGIKYRGEDNSTSSASNVVGVVPDYTGPVWYVEAENSYSGGEGSLEDPMQNIRDAIEAAADGDTIMLMPGTYNHSKNRNLDFQYSYDAGVRNLTLMSQYGADTTIINLQGNDFIDINNGETDSRIEGLTIQNSSSGAITVWYNSSVEINNCIFLNNSNSSETDGGALDIQETNDRVTISNTLFKSNSSSSRGGAIFIGMDGTDVAVVNCIFDGNTASEAGGAINQDNNTNLLVVHSLFIDNSSNSDSWAGGVNSFAGMYGSTTIINSIFTGNTDNSGSTNSDINTSGDYMNIDHCVLQSESNEVFNYGDNYVLNEDYILNDPENGDIH
jgi:predicted outer membrane repeat protein